jgi:hypothetical protein
VSPFGYTESVSIYIDSGDKLHNDQAATLALTCPHCQIVSHVTPQAVPGFAELTAVRPKQIGIVYRCDACNSPIFLRFTVRHYTPARIELSSQFSEIERPRERFSFTYVPEQVEILFREALTCFTHGALNAFATMCRRTMQTVFSISGEAGRLRMFDELNDVREMAEIDSDDFATIKRVVFGTDADPLPMLPLLNEDQSGLLLEVMKDLLYQTYVRKGHLQQAMVVRRFFSEEAHNGKPTQVDGGAHA